MAVVSTGNCPGGAVLVPVMVWFLQEMGRGQEESLPTAALFVGVISLHCLIFNPCVDGMDFRHHWELLLGLDSVDDHI
jgi:hypothetical protein